MKNLKNKKGFTLIELIVVLAILGILMLILVPSFLGYANDAKTQVLRANTRSVWTAAKAAESKSEYDSNITLVTYDKAAKTDSSSLKKEVESKLGSAFTDKTEATVNVVGKVSTITEVKYYDGTKTCEYSGGDTFDSTSCTY